VPRLIFVLRPSEKSEKEELSGRTPSRKRFVLFLTSMLILAFSTLSSFVFFSPVEASEFGNQVKFRGLVVSDEKWGEIVAYGSYYCDVTILEVLYDPNSTLSVNDNVTVAYQEPLSLHIGDNVECYGVNCINCPTSPKQCWGYIVCKPSPLDPTPYYVMRYPPKLLLKTDKSIYKLGENVTITLTNVSNETIEIGGYPAWQIFTYPAEDPVYPMIFAFLAWSLNSGENDTFIWNQYNEFTWSFCTVGTYVIKDTQAWGLSAFFKISILGDVDGNFKVDMKDIGFICRAYGSYPGHPRWNPNADINGDNKVNMKDVSMAASNFGKKTT
jgi:hypothetical protein